MSENHLDALFGTSVSDGFGGGVASDTFLIPPSLQFSIQGFVIDSACSTWTPPVVVSQAFDVAT